VVQDGIVHWSHVGDSRAYHLRNGNIVSRTRDHSQVEEMVRLGVIGADQARGHTQRHIVTRCMGSSTHMPVPDFSAPTPLQANDTLLLCTDGLWGPLNEDSFATTLSTGDLHVSLNRLAQAAEVASQPRSDNITAIAFRWLGEKSSE
jgi:serine/threonine protein phosphatase PrpC